MKYENSAIRGYRNSSAQTYLKVNKELNQRDFHLFMLPCPEWGVRGKILSETHEDSAVFGYRNSSIKTYLKVNKGLNQRDFNLFMLPCSGWGVRGRILSKIKEFLTFDSILMGVLLCLTCSFLI